MSRNPTGTTSFSNSLILSASRTAMGTPRRRIPMKAKRFKSCVFSRTSCARRTSVLSISEALINWAFSRVGAINRTFPLQRNISMLEPIVDSLGDFLYVLGLLESGDGQNVPVVLLQIRFELVGEFRQLAGVVQRLLKVGFQ